MSQTIWTGTVERGEPIVTIDSAGNRTLHVHIDDAILIAEGLMSYELIIDSLIPEYKQSIADRDTKISMTEEKLRKLGQMSDNCDEYSRNLDKIFDNMRKIDGLKDLTIENSEKTIKRQRILQPIKIVGAGVGGVLLGVGVAVVLKSYFP